MRLKFGFFAGLLLGYYLGAMAGRERYEQLNRLLRKAKRSDVVDSATDAAKSAADTGFSRARNEIKHRLGRNGSAQSTPYAPS